MQSLSPPPFYIPGLGRGATSFTTRSDIGPIGSNPEPAYNYKTEFDEFQGNDSGLFASAKDYYDDDDKEADAIWESIDQRMSSRRRKDKIENLPKITNHFAGLKRNLLTMSFQDWDNIPDSYNSIKNNYKKKRFESFVPVPDTVLSLKLDRLSDSVSGLTVVDPKGYLTDLKSMKITNEAEVSDIKKARLLLKSFTCANPSHPSGWVAAARLEEVAGKIGAARKLIERGCHECPKNEDVWLESCRLFSNPEDAKRVVANGVKAVPNSVKLWIRASELERDEASKSRVLRKGIERIPDSVRLWKAVVELANEEDARILLRRAVECCPLNVELWLALARLESYDNARKVLKKARSMLPKEPSVWVTFAKLEEANGSTEATVAKIIESGIRGLEREGVAIDREAWMKEAEAAEQARSVATCRAIIRSTIWVGVENEDRKRTWVAEAEECEKRGSIDTARAIYAHALAVFPNRKSVWIVAANLEKSHGTRESLDALLRKAVTYVPRAEAVWMMRAKEKWLVGDVAASRAILREAYDTIPNSEEILLAAFKLEFESHEPERARTILAKSLERGGTERVWMKSAIVERELGNAEEERKFLVQGLKQFPSFFKLWLMLGQLEDRLGSTKQHVKGVYESGLKNCPNCIPLWVSLAEIEEKMSGLSKARAVLTNARKKNPKNPEIWLAAIRAEFRHGNKKEAEILMEKALRECPKSGILWAASIEMVPRHQRKIKSMDAYKKCDNDAYVLVAIAKLFWDDRKVDKARNSLNMAVTLAPDIGDFWALYYKFEIQHGSDENQKDVLSRCVGVKPKHGEKWQAVAKAVENAHISTESVLKKVVLAFGKEDISVNK